jgi:4-amino-4-deoxy-L-arabinose transferase-like glycosyltransferase
MVSFAVVTVHTIISDLLSNYPVLPALLISAAWFYAGHKYLAEGNLVGAFLWQGVGVLILIALCVNIVLSGNKSGLNLAVALVAIGVELWIIKKWWRRKYARR